MQAGAGQAGAQPSAPRQSDASTQHNTLTGVPLPSLAPGDTAPAASLAALIPYGPAIAKHCLLHLKAKRFSMQNYSLTSTPLAPLACPLPSAASLAALIPYGPAIAEHCLLDAGLSPNTKLSPEDSEKLQGSCAALLPALGRLDAWFSGLEQAPAAGFITLAPPGEQQQ